MQNLLGTQPHPDSQVTSVLTPLWADAHQGRPPSGIHPCDFPVGAPFCSPTTPLRHQGSSQLCYLPQARALPKGANLANAFNRLLSRGRCPIQSEPFALSPLGSALWDLSSNATGRGGDPFPLRPAPPAAPPTPDSDLRPLLLTEASFVSESAEALSRRRREPGRPRPGREEPEWRGEARCLFLSLPPTRRGRSGRLNSEKRSAPLCGRVAKCF